MKPIQSQVSSSNNPPMARPRLDCFPAALARRLAAFTLILFALQSSLSAATYYVDFVSGSDSNSSTQAQSQSTPWKHMPGMNEATGNANAYSQQSGDVFVLKGGVTWTFSTTNDLITIGTNNITVIGGQQLGTPWGTGYPVIDGTGQTAPTCAIAFPGKTGVTINGLKLINMVVASTGDGYGIFLVSSGSPSGVNCEIANCVIDNCGTNALQAGLSGGAHFKFHGNKVSNCGRVFIAANETTGFDDVQIYNNEFLGPGTYHGFSHTDGVMIGAACASGPSNFTNIVIHHNKFYGDWSGGATGQIYLNDAAGPHSASYYGGYHCKIYDNQFCVDRGAFMDGIVYCETGWDDVQIFNNTFSTNGSVSACIATSVMPNGVTWTIKNNVFDGCSLGMGFCYAQSTGPTVIADYNLYNTTGLIINRSASYNTLSAARAAGYETNGGVGDPKFITLPNGTTGHGNWHLQLNSPAIGVGANLSSLSLYTDDCDGGARGAVWDIGAFQVTHSLAAAPSNAHTAIAVY